MGKANIYYNPRQNRWEIRGKGGTLLKTITDDSNPTGIVRTFVGSTAAINAGIASLSVATLAGASGKVQLGDLVFVTAKTQNTKGGHVAVSVPSNDLVLLTVFGSLPAMGWDAYVIRPITG